MVDTRWKDNAGQGSTKAGLGGRQKTWLAPTCVGAAEGVLVGCVGCKVGACANSVACKSKFSS
jgi:hypothetical protein